MAQATDWWAGMPVPSRLTDEEWSRRQHLDALKEFDEELGVEPGVPEDSRYAPYRYLDEALDRQLGNRFGSVCRVIG